MDFFKFFGIVMEIFFIMCDDIELDVRMVVDECLNRFIKVKKGWIEVYKYKVGKY